MFKRVLFIEKIKSYIKRMEVSFGKLSKKVLKVNTAIILFTLAFVIMSLLIYLADDIGLSAKDKSTLVWGLLIIVGFVFFLAVFKPDALLMTAEQRLELHKIERGHAEQGEDEVKYIIGESRGQKAIGTGKEGDE